MTTPDDRGKVALNLVAIAMEWIEPRINDLADFPSILIYPSNRNVTILFGYHSFESKSLTKLFALFAGQTAIRKLTHETWEYFIGDETCGLLFKWYVWKRADDSLNTTEVTL